MASAAHGAEEFAPPLPKCVLDVLDRTRLCYLGSVLTDDASPSPHLSLMNFSSIQLSGEGDVGIVMSTKMATKKFTALEKNPKVAILIHDFEGLRSGSHGSVVEDAPTSPVPEGSAKKEDDFYSRGSYSVTIYGSVEILTADGCSGDADKQGLRKRCLDSLMAATSKKYQHFMEGDDCALLLVRPQLARICNIMDSVTTWERPSAAAAKA